MIALPALFASKTGAVLKLGSVTTARYLSLTAALSIGLGFNLIGAAQEIEQPTNVQLMQDSPAIPVSEIGSDQAVITKKLLGSERVCVSSQDEIWIVSARTAHHAPGDLSMLEVCQLRDGCWKYSSLSELVSGHSLNKSLSTMVFVHGNGFNMKWCKARGLQFYQSVFQGGACRPPLRLILFSWKSESEIVRPIADFKIKSNRSVILGMTFANFLEQFEDRNMLICTYSLGAQVVLQALERPELVANEGVDYRVVMLAPVFDANFVYRCTRLFAENPHVSRTEVFVNRKDRAIKVANRVTRKKCGRCTSMLSVLNPTSQFVANSICINNISNEVNGSHFLGNYSESESIQSKLTAMLCEVNLASQSHAHEASSPGLSVEDLVSTVLPNPAVARADSRSNLNLPSAR